MNVILFIIHVILLLLLLYLYLRFHRFRKMIEAHTRRFQEHGFTKNIPLGTEEGIEKSLSEMGDKIIELKEILDENRELKETTGKITKELLETREHLTNKIAELHALFDISTSISLLTESGNLYKSIPEALKRYLGIEKIAIFLFEELKDYFEKEVIKIGEGVVGKVYSTGESVYIPDMNKISAQVYARGLKRDVRSVIAVPLKKRDRTIGVFYISHTEDNAFDPETLGTVKTLVRNIAIAIENTELYQYAKMLAERDSLTLLYNHGTFHSRLGYEVDRAGRYRRPLTVVMLDIDSFKLVNDKFGHITGDRILKMVAGVINAHTRKTDIAARYGGDEFAILLPETNHDAALAIARRINSGLKNLKVDTGRGGDISVTASFGIASCRHDSVERLNIVDVADTLMYTAKNAGYGEIVSKII
jgi:diguanylate cyclase (GGDEF)-like protein